MTARRLIGWLLILGITSCMLLFVLVWTVGSSRMPAAPAPIGEELAIGFFDPHLHIQMLELVELESLPEVAPPMAGSKRYAMRLQARSTAIERFADPSRLVVSVRSGRSRLTPLAIGPVEVDGLPVLTRFQDVLDVGEMQQAWFLFDIPENFESPELWLARDTWMARNVYGWETGPLHDRAVFQLDLPTDSRASDPQE